MRYCLERCVEFLKQTVTSTTFNELLHWLVAAFFIAFGLAGLNSVAAFPPIVLLISIIATAATLERWLAIPHVTIVSGLTVLIWLPSTFWHETFSNSVETIMYQHHVSLIKVYLFPMMVAAFTGALTTLSDIWKAQIDVALMLAVLPTLAEIFVFSLLYLINGGPYGWALLTALCLCGWDHRLMQHRAALMEQHRVLEAMRNDLPHLMRSSLLLNQIICTLAFTFGAQFVSPCWTSLTENGNDTWTVIGSDCIDGFFTSTEAYSAATRIGPYALSAIFGAILAGVLFVFGRHTGAPKTQILAAVTVIAIPVLFQATISRVESNKPNDLHWLHGAEPLSCFLVAAGLVYGWKKNHNLNFTGTRVTHMRTNVKLLLYVANVGLHCYLAYTVLSYCLSSDDKFYEMTLKKIRNADIDLPQEYLLSFRRDKHQLLITVLVAVLAASSVKVATVVGILKWKYGTSFTHSLYVGTSTVAKGSFVGLLSCYVLMVRIALPEFGQLKPDGTELRVLSGQQLAYSVDMIIAMVIANLVANPIATIVSAITSRRWKRNRRTEVALN